jgi:hypothetical protein
MKNSNESSIRNQRNQKKHSSDNVEEK